MILLLPKDVFDHSTNKFELSEIDFLMTTLCKTVIIKSKGKYYLPSRRGLHRLSLDSQDEDKETRKG